MAARITLLAKTCLVSFFIKQSVNNTVRFITYNISRGFLMNAGKAAAPQPTETNQAVSDPLRSSGPVEHHSSLIQKGALQKDRLQRDVIQRLDKLQKIIEVYCNIPVSFTKTSTANSPKSINTEDVPCKEERLPKPRPPKGLYIHGPAGTGKTMIMDMFYSQVDVVRKKRVHFNGFMLDVHKRIHLHTQNQQKRRLGELHKFYDHIARVSDEISEETCLLCLDEFQVTDIADAVILRSLFEKLFLSGVVVVATSNRPPEDLYKNGLRRANFVPFIAVLKEYCQTICLDSGIDYRKRGPRAAEKFYYLTSETDVEAVMDKLFDELAQKQNDITGPRTLKVWGRPLSLRKTCGTLADCTFQELCGRPLGASDYLEMSRFFDTVFIRHIPQLTLAERTQARRLITLIDTFYDQKVRVVISADTEMDSIFVHDQQSGQDEGSRLLMDDLEQHGEDASQLSVFTGEEEIFAFQRTVSRLTEMQTYRYWAREGRCHGSL